VPTASFVHSITVPADAIDQFGHANNIAYVRWIQDVAVAHSNHVGLDWAAYAAMGAAFVVRRHEVDYLRAVREGEVLSVGTWIESFTRITSERGTTVHNAHGALVARAMTTWVFVTIDGLRPVRITDPVKRAFGVL
jgi:acyl-CoA thioester hydrolase